MTAEELMTENPTVIPETATVGEAYELLSEAEVRHLPVVRGTEVVGMLSDRDFRGLGLSLVTDEEQLDDFRARLSAPVANLMSGNVISVTPDAELTQVIDLMLEERLGAFPVVEEHTNELRGIVSYVDVLRSVRDQVS